MPTIYKITLAGALAALMTTLALVSNYATSLEKQLDRADQERAEAVTRAAARARLDMFLHKATDTMNEDDLTHATPAQQAALAEILD